ncbi:hypothetical protein AMTR_s00059p00136910 [Amborella trichopoda]|uniref:Protein BZR1 homolog n=2 Tax=Amborella trichopoda TaxID=13333 RepID=U5D840_AMBTC|nr:hypothetical protein AMTR_s00059p00136910 [Amborella trichopoda]
MDTGAASTTITPSSSYHPSPQSSSFPSPSHPSSHYDSSLHPHFLSLPPLRISNSAPVTPPLTSPKPHHPHHPNASFFASAPSSPTRRTSFYPIPECLDESFSDASTPRPFPPSPTFTLVCPSAPSRILSHAGILSPNGFLSPNGMFSPNGILSPNGLLSPNGMLSPNGILSPPNGVLSPNGMLSPPVVPRKENDGEFEFECVKVKPWEGERIHEECAEMIGGEDLELRLGTSSAN